MGAPGSLQEGLGFSVLLPTLERDPQSQQRGKIARIPVKCVAKERYRFVAVSRLRKKRREIRVAQASFGRQPDDLMETLFRCADISQPRRYESDEIATGLYHTGGWAR